MITLLFLSKNSHTSIDMLAGALLWCKIHDWFFHNSVHFLRIASHIGAYFKVVFLIDRTTLWQEFMMHCDIAIEENSGHNLQIWPNLTRVFRSSLLDASIGMIGLWFQCHSYTPIIRPLSKSGSSLNVVNIS